MGLFKKKIVKKTYDREHMKPVIRASICTGEEVAGFKDIRTGKIEEIMLIRSPEELESAGSGQRGLDRAVLHRLPDYPEG